ncbi:MAG: hypothetical protein V4613_07070 [Bacteroidota bacterium]
MMKVIRSFAWFFSILFHPLLMLNAGIASILLIHPYYSSKYYDEQMITFVLYLFVNTLIMPLLAILLLKRFKYIDTVTIPNFKQRTLPYIVIALLLGVTAYQLNKNEMNGLPLIFLISAAVSLLINAAITLKFGVSSHGISAGGLVGLMFYTVAFQHISQFELWLFVSILIAGISGSSRLILGAHTPQQLYWGYGIGFAVVMLCLTLL